MGRAHVRGVRSADVTRACASQRWPALRSRWVSGAGVSCALAQLLLAERVLLREDVLTERPAAEQLARRRRLEALGHGPRALRLVVRRLLLLVETGHANRRHAHRTTPRHRGRRTRRQHERLRGASREDGQEKAPHGLRRSRRSRWRKRADAYTPLFGKGLLRNTETCREAAVPAFHMALTCLT